MSDEDGWVGFHRVDDDSPPVMGGLPASERVTTPGARVPCPVHDFSGGFCTSPCPDQQRAQREADAVEIPEGSELLIRFPCPDCRDEDGKPTGVRPPDWAVTREGKTPLPADPCGTCEGGKVVQKWVPVVAVTLADFIVDPDRS